MRYLWTTIGVNNLEESINFYTDLVGLQVLQRFPAGPGVEIAFLGNGCDNETLVELLAGGTHNEAGIPETLSIGFAVQSADAMLETVKRKGIAVHSGPMETPKYKFFTIKDPNGLNVQFFQQK